MSYFDNLTIDNIKIGIAISTFTENKTSGKRYDIIEKSLNSLNKYLESTNLNIYTVVVVDGDIPQRHNSILNEVNNLNKNIIIHKREKNGGVARTKNTSIRLLLEQNVDIGFLMDDDVYYKKDCFEQYVNAIINGKIHHIGFCQMHPLVHPKNEWEKMGYIQTNINGQEVMKHGGGGVGCLLSFTKRVIEKIGYFKVMSGKYGYEHINFTHRCVENGLIPFPNDIIEPLKYIDHIGFEPVGYNKFNKSHSISESYRKTENSKNKYEWKLDMNKYVKCIE